MHIYRVIDSNLQIPLDKPRSFLLRNLNPKGDSHAHLSGKISKLQIENSEARVKHDIISCNPSLPMNYFLGAFYRQHLNGNIKQFRISSRNQSEHVISENNKIQDQGTAKLDLNFAKSPNQVLQHTGFLPGRFPKRLISQTGHWLCHVILTSNEFFISLIMACFQIDQPFICRHFLNSAGGLCRRIVCLHEPLLARASNNPPFRRFRITGQGKECNLFFHGRWTQPSRSLTPNHYSTNLPANPSR